MAPAASFLVRVRAQCQRQYPTTTRSNNVTCAAVRCGRTTAIWKGISKALDDATLDTGKAFCDAFRRRCANCVASGAIYAPSDDRDDRQRPSCPHLFHPAALIELRTRPAIRECAATIVSGRLANQRISLIGYRL